VGYVASSTHLKWWLDSLPNRITCKSTSSWEIGNTAS